MERAGFPTSAGRSLFRAGLGLCLLIGLSGNALAQRPKGVDVSQFQGTSINWTQVYQAGYVFAFIRGSHGSLVDTRFVQNMTGAKNAGLLVGAYHYAVPVDQQYGSNYLYGADPVTDANYFLNSAGARDYIVAGYLRPVLDVEHGGGQVPVGATSLANWVIAWLNHVEQQTGVKAMIYCNTNYAQNYLGNCTISNYPLWIANWSYTEAQSQTQNPPIGIWNSCSPPKGWAFWQWTSSGNTSGFPTVPGINARVDLNVFNGTLATLQNYMITAPGIITLAPGALSFSVRQGLAPAPQNFTVRNSGGGTMTYAISTVPHWLSVNPAGGSSTGETDTMAASCTAAGLLPGSYVGTISVASGQAANTPQEIAVTLNVTPVPGDLNANGFVDDADFNLFHACMTGPGLGPPGSGCATSDLDGDNDVDQSDFALLQRCFAGPLTLADPTCAP